MRTTWNLLDNMSLAFARDEIHSRDYKTEHRRMKPSLENTYFFERDTDLIPLFQIQKITEVDNEDLTRIEEEVRFKHLFVTE